VSIELTALNDVMQLILDDVCAGLTCSTYGAPKDCFISHTHPADDCCDFAAIWMHGLYPTMRFPLPDESTPDRCGEFSRMMRVYLRVKRPCWPTVRDNAKSPFPPSSEIQSAAEGLLIDANIVWCRLSSGIASGIYLPEGSGCLDFKLMELIMDRPRGGCAGFTVRLAVELDACCDGGLC
jgi:hypothetical protein